MAAKKSGKTGKWPPRFILTDPARQPDPAYAIDVAKAGEGVIYRAYGKKPSAASLRELGRRARRKHALFLVAGNDRSARLLHVDGLHLPEFRLGSPPTEHMFAAARRPKSPFRVTAAAHSEAAIVRAARAGVDAVLISPVFATPSHPGAKPLGVVRFARLASIARGFGLRVYALGGMTETGRGRLRGAGVAGIGGIRIFSSGPNRRRALRTENPSECSRTAPSGHDGRR